MTSCTHQNQRTHRQERARTRRPGAAVPAAVLAAVILGLAGCGGTTLEFTLTDAVNGSWVWNANVHLQNRSMPLFFQSDRGPVVQRFTDLVPGSSQILVEAPGYQPVRVPVRLKRGTNRLAEPLRMLGIDLPGLDHWLVVERVEDADIVGELRPIASDGTAVMNHPCLALWVGARICEQVRNGVPVQQKMERGASRGKELFRGQVAWEWDGTPEKTFRYSVRIPGARIAASTAPLRVIDYLVVVPDPSRIALAEVDRLMAGLRWDDPDELVRGLTAGKDRLWWQLSTSWNVAPGTP